MISFFNPLINQKISHTCNVHKHYAASYIALWKPNLNEQKHWFYLEMVSHRAIDGIMQTPKKEVHFFSSQFVVLLLIALDN